MWQEPCPQQPYRCGNDGGDLHPHAGARMGGMFDVTHGAGLPLYGAAGTILYRDCLPRFVQYALNVMVYSLARRMKIRL
jgi:hypothetical protein